MIARFTIPLPPSLNNIFFNKPHGGRAKTTDYKNWLEATAWEIRSQQPPIIKGEVCIDLLIERPTASSDLDNRIKAALDACQKAGVIENDKRVVELRARWGQIKGCQVTIFAVEKVAA